MPVDGAVLTPIDPPPAPVPYDAAPGCSWLPDGSAPNDEARPCGGPAPGTGSSAHPGLAWVLAPNGSGGRTLTVYRVSEGKAQAVLSATDQTGAAWGEVTPRLVSLHGLAEPALVVGFRTSGSAGQLQVDVVSSAGTVAFHRDLDQGRAEVGNGEYEDWAARYASDDPNCCPSAYEHSVVRLVNGQWRIVIDEMVPPDQVPKGQFS